MHQSLSVLRRISVPWILGVERLLHATRPRLNVRDHTEPSSHQLSRFFLVNTRPEHQEVSIGIFDVEQEPVLATRVQLGYVLDSSSPNR